MLKYFRDIIAQFNPAQRIIALLLLIFCVICLTLGPKLISALSYDDTELKTIVTNQKTEITQLNVDVTKLHNEIIVNQQECTDRILAREKEMLKQIDSIIRQSHRNMSEEKIMALNKTLESQETNSETKNNSRIARSEQVSNDLLLKGLSEMRNGLEKSIKKNN